MKLGLTDIWEKHGERLDFLIKADDDTFLVMDNLMARLQGRDPEKPFMMGHKLTNEVKLIKSYFFMVVWLLFELVLHKWR